MGNESETGPHSDVKGSGSTYWCCRCLVGRKAEIPIHWVGPPPTNSGILGIHKPLNKITITPCGHYQWVAAQPNVYSGDKCNPQKL